MMNGECQELRRVMIPTESTDRSGFYKFIRNGEKAVDLMNHFKMGKDKFCKVATVLEGRLPRFV